MIESGFYAPGTEFDKNSPWNQVENPEEEFNVTIVETLSKDVTIHTSNYQLEKDYDEDDNSMRDYIDSSDTNWKEEYKKQGCTAIETIIAVKVYLEEVRLEQLKDIAYCRKLTQEEQRELKVVKDLIEQCKGWQQDEIEFCPE